MLQGDAGSCRVLQYGTVRSGPLLETSSPPIFDVAWCCKVLQGVVVCYSVYKWSASESHSYIWCCEGVAGYCRILSYAVCCSVLQCVAVCCSVLQCAAVCCSVLQCVAECCSALKRVAMCCRVLQCDAECYSMSQ